MAADERSQDISSHGFDLVCLEYASFNIRWLSLYRIPNMYTFGSLKAPLLKAVTLPPLSDQKNDCAGH